MDGTNKIKIRGNYFLCRILSRNGPIIECLQKSDQVQHGLEAHHIKKASLFKFVNQSKEPTI